MPNVFAFLPILAIVTANTVACDRSTRLGPGNSLPVSLSVQPETTSLRVDSITQLTATVQDTTGDTIDRAVDWSSTNPPVATVSEDGLVTGEDVGTAGIVAEAGEARDTAVVAVISSDGCRMSLDHPHEPNGMTEIFHADGTDKHFDNWNETSKWANDTNAPLNVEVVPDDSSPSACPNPIGTDSVLVYRTFAGERGGGLTTLTSFSDIGLQPYQEIYISYWIFHDPNYDLSHGHKHWFGGGAFEDGSPTEYYLTHQTSGDLWLTKQTGPTGSARMIDAPGQVWKLGAWQHIEIHLIGESSVGAGDAVAKLWVDGDLMGENSSIQWTDTSDTTTKFSGIQLYPIAGDTNDHDDYHLIGEFYWSGKNP